MKDNTTDSEIELKNCPFCGGKAVLRFASIGWKYENTAYVICTKCGASSDHLYITYRSRKKELTDKLIDLWNCRSDGRIRVWD